MGNRVGFLRRNCARWRDKTENAQVAVITHSGRWTEAPHAKTPQATSTRKEQGTHQPVPTIVVPNWFVPTKRSPMMTAGQPPHHHGPISHLRPRTPDICASKDRNQRHGKAVRRSPLLIRYNAAPSLSDSTLGSICTLSRRSHGPYRGFVRKKQIQQPQPRGSVDHATGRGHATDAVPSS